MMSLSLKERGMTFMNFYIRNQMVSLRMLYSGNLDINLQDWTFGSLIYRKRWETEQTYYYCYQVGRACICRSWSWPTFSRSRIVKCEYLQNGESWRKWSCFYSARPLPPIHYQTAIVWCLAFLEIGLICRHIVINGLYISSQSAAWVGAIV